jgi:S1-C subfamily serine protease
VSPALAEELRIDPSIDGVVILEVANGTPAQSYGFQRGDVVLSVNNQKTSKTRDLERATAQPSRVWRITVKRGEQLTTITLSG